MPMHVAMLRGVNVGARSRVKMTDLVKLFEELGHTNVATYIQSGNVVFSSRSKNTAALSRAIEQLLSGWIFDVIPASDEGFDQAKDLVVTTICNGLEPR